MTIRRWALGLLLGGGSLVLSACNSGGGLKIDAARGAFAFIPANVTTAAATASNVTFNNPDSVVHDWTIDSIEVGGTVQKIQLLAQPSKSDSKTFTFTKGGNYFVYCSQPRPPGGGYGGSTDCTVILTIGIV